MFLSRIKKKIRRIKKKIRRTILSKSYQPSVDKGFAKEIAKHVDWKVLQYWFSCSTNPDKQLRNFKNENQTIYKYPSFAEISFDLFGVKNMYSEKKTTENINVMPYPAHIGPKTIKKVESLLGREPKFGIEVGSFIGSSATIWGNFMKKNNGALLCIDTWCGDINMWLRSEFEGTMKKQDGNPKIFDAFLHRIQVENLETTVIPLRTSSMVGARILKVLNYKIDFVYLDSAHEAGETFMEVCLFWDLLRQGGVLIGDDYEGFPAVKHDIDIFCKAIGANFSFTGDSDTWVLKKTK